jgi:hypothetical protein
MITRARPAGAAAAAAASGIGIGRSSKSAPLVLTAVALDRVLISHQRLRLAADVGVCPNLHKLSEGVDENNMPRYALV